VHEPARARLIERFGIDLQHQIGQAQQSAKNETLTSYSTNMEETTIIRKAALFRSRGRRQEEILIINK